MTGVVTDLENNVQAYRTMAEMLLGLRKIVLHGLRKQCGDGWPTEGCPAKVYERLVQRKETEQAIERLSAEDEDLMSFATFADLAETIEGNERLAALLHNLAPSAEVLCARLTDLEALRGKLARGILLSPEELDMLSRYSGHLRETLAGARRKKGRGRRTGTGSDAEPAEEAGSTDAGPGPRRRTAPAPAVEAASDPAPEASAAAEEPQPKRARRPPPACQVQPPPDLVPNTEQEPAAAPPAEAAEVPAPAAKPQPPGNGATPSPFDPEVLAEDVQKAMVDDDDAEVLRLLRQEVIAAAEAMYRGEREIAVRGWQEVVRDGWLGRRRADLALDPLEEFHRLLEEYEARRRSSDGGGDVARAFLGERQFPKLLLTLRETFRTNGL